MHTDKYNKFIKERLKDILSSKEKYQEHITKLKFDPEYKEMWEKQKSDKLKKWWSELKPFKSSTDVPQLPNPLNDFYINRLIDLGAIPKSKLKDGQWYYGNFRNSTFGKWDSDKSVFHHIRYSFGYYWDECNHFEDDDRFALFVPLREATLHEIKEEHKKIKNKTK